MVGCFGGGRGTRKAREKDEYIERLDKLQEKINTLSCDLESAQKGEHSLRSSVELLQESMEYLRQRIHAHDSSEESLASRVSALESSTSDSTQLNGTNALVQRLVALENDSAPKAELDAITHRLLELERQSSSNEQLTDGLAWAESAKHSLEQHLYSLQRECRYEASRSFFKQSQLDDFLADLQTRHERLEGSLQAEIERAQSAEHETWSELQTLVENVQHAVRSNESELESVKASALQAASDAAHKRLDQTELDLPKSSYVKHLESRIGALEANLKEQNSIDQLIARLGDVEAKVSDQTRPDSALKRIEKLEYNQANVESIDAKLNAVHQQLHDKATAAAEAHYAQTRQVEALRTSMRHAEHHRKAQAETLAHNERRLEALEWRGRDHLSPGTLHEHGLKQQEADQRGSATCSSCSSKQEQPGKMNEQMKRLEARMLEIEEKQRSSKTAEQVEAPREQLAKDSKESQGELAALKERVERLERAGEITEEQREQNVPYLERMSGRLDGLSGQVKAERRIPHEMATIRDEEHNREASVKTAADIIPSVAHALASSDKRSYSKEETRRVRHILRAIRN
jgi:chromosome segregation ATPase